MDPHSITFSTTTLLQQLFTVSRTLITYLDHVRNPDKCLGYLRVEIDSLSTLLKAFDNTLKDPMSSYSRSLSEGYEDAEYLECVRVSIKYCQQTIQSLEDALKEDMASGNGIVKRLIRPIKLSLKGDEIAMYRQQIVSYRETIGLASQWMSVYFPPALSLGLCRGPWLIKQVIGVENTTCNEHACHQIGNIVANNRQNTP
jgi:hypothetical protein